MANLIIDDEVLQRLREIAELEQRPLEEVLRLALEYYRMDLPDLTPKHKSKYPDWLPRTDESPDYDPLDDLIGMIDADITDASTTVRETMEEYYRKKYSGST